MKYKIAVLLIVLLSLFTIKPYAATPPDIIHEMDVNITPQSDGSLNINYCLDYEAATDFPSDTQYLEIGVPNSSFTIVDYSRTDLVNSAYEKNSGTSQVHLGFSRLPKKGDRFQINFTINQRSMMYDAGNNNVSMQFRPTWFDFAVIDQLKVTLNTQNYSPAQLNPSPSGTTSAGPVWITKDMKTNQKADLITVVYPRTAFPDLKNVQSKSS